MHKKSAITQSGAIQSALRLLEDANVSTQKAIALLRASGQEALADQIQPAKLSATPDTSSVRDNDAHDMLMPKILALSDVIDDMSDDEWGEWINALPKEEFFEFIAVSGTAESFWQAVAFAKSKVGA